ncbi:MULTISPECIES: serine hydrolase domain-containing protein [Streptomyces]|uniref:Serine hydrolase domain-containing protein n=1 Tax=Streptomyces lonegramiae TaxID=3075524 RepID=A0ABU2XTF5_9ACTN|nr:serine hydrolase domain-containing protein [Streptomyces sp. DSM 41529]MDT0549117.1 serine hydrolase domain-containing protein [Streptomyces sp. DSM 41529]
MHHRPSALRRLAVTGVALAVITAGTCVPAAMASAAGPQQAAVADSFDPAPMRDLLGHLPDPVVAGALVRVAGDGPAMPWAGTAGEVSRDAHFRIGSVTKIFTSTVVLQLAAEHRIAVDAPVRRYLPDLIPAAYGAVTVRELMDHTSGLPAPAGIPGPADGPGWWQKSVSPRDVVHNAFAAAASQATQPTEPDSVQQYNGVNTFVLGLLVEKVTGRSFNDELTRRIILPLGLRDTSLPASDDLSIATPHARVYVGADEVTEQSPWAWAEGGMISTAADLDRFMTALFRGRLLPPAQQKLAFTVPNVASAPTNTNCINGTSCFSAGGLMRVTLDNGVTVWGKTGSLPGWTNGVFATRDLTRRVVYSLNPTGTASERPYVMAVINAAFEHAG